MTKLENDGFTHAEAAVIIDVLADLARDLPEELAVRVADIVAGRERE
jgi:hypothetical protein